MGKGDRKTAKGKRFFGSYGITRKRNSIKTNSSPKADNLIEKLVGEGTKKVKSTSKKAASEGTEVKPKKITSTNKKVTPKKVKED